jgi:nucleosome-remodeling factor 38 kDa subunit
LVVEFRKKSLQLLLLLSSNVTVEGSPFIVTEEQAEEFLSKASEGGEAEPLSSTIDKWHFVHLK